MSDAEITRVVCAMSGGVDSTVAAVLALERGYRCTGITLGLFGKAEASPDFADAKKAAEGLGFEHFLLDFSKEFDEYVIRHFVETYEQGATPNPCIDCNRRIKFNMALLQEKLKIKQLSLFQNSVSFVTSSGKSSLKTTFSYKSKVAVPKTEVLEQPQLCDFDKFVTGHYARVKQDPVSGRYLLQKALDDKKDQSYVLYSLTQQQLQKACFPLGELTKNEVRKIAESKNLVNAAKGESQDICFVPTGDYGSFIEEYTGKTYPAGDIIDLEGKIIGRHKGLIRYTIGQRRGLGVAANTPVYVVSKSAKKNTVTLGQDNALYSKSLNAKDINLIACTDIKKPKRVMVRTRYLQAAQSAVAEQTADDNIHIEFDNPQRAITPGQAAVMYDGDIVIGGGTIAELVPKLG